MKIFALLFPLILFVSCNNVVSEEETNEPGICGNTSRENINHLMVSEEFAEHWENGKILFKQNCASCHKLNKNSIGPMLKGTLSKWEENDEVEILYDFILDPIKVYESGKSNYVNEIWEFSKTDMPSNPHLTKEDAKDIMDYVDFVSS